ncbi:MAG: putative cytochrome c biosis protein, partial [Oscillospiraceae bacterium]|nr:putative cytochrome c biosis protein [Oscillospiraceae bacterium]
MEAAIHQWLDILSTSIMSNIWLAPVLALFAGIISAFTPCCLSTVPLVIGYVGGTGEKDTKKAFWLSVTFSCGMGVTFTVLGTIASLLGKLLQGSGSWWYLILG